MSECSIASLRERQRIQATRSFISESLPNHNNLILDAGTGSGVITFGMKNVVGLDIDKPNLLLNPLDDKVLADVCHIPFKDNAFGFAIMTEVIEHLPDKPKVIQAFHELRRVSERLFISTPNNCLLRKSLWKLRHKNLSSRFHTYEYSWKEIKDIAESVGFRLREFSGLGFVVEKPSIFKKMGKYYPKLSSKVLMLFGVTNY